MFGIYRCQMRDHNEQQIIGMCQNQNCQQPSRMVCFDCIKDHEKYDKKFNINDIKNEKGIQMIIDEFKNYRIDVINNTILQCEIQQYLLHAELIRYLKLWNFKFNELNRILEQVNNFNLMQWTQIRLDDFISKSQKKQSIFSYLDQFQQKIFQLEDLKDNYIKQTFLKQKFDDKVVFLKQNFFMQDTIPTIQKNQTKIYEKIQENVLFKLQQRKESPQIALCEIFLREGFALKTDNMYNYFQQYYMEIIQNDLEEFQSLYLKSFAYFVKNDPQESITIEALNLIEQALKKNNNYLYFIILQVACKLTKIILLKGLKLLKFPQVWILNTFILQTTKDGFYNR